MSQPNILYLHSHDTGRWIQPHGYAAPTPNLQRFAEQGVLFRQAYSCAPTCSPSRAALLTGQYPHCCGMTGLTHRGWSLNDPSQHLANFLRQHGYSSVLAGVQHEANPLLAEPWKTLGYQRYLGESDQAHIRAAEFLTRSPPQPFFLSVGFAQTHRPFPSETMYDKPAYCLPQPPLPDTPETRIDVARFKAALRTLDYRMGVVLRALDQSGLTAHTLVICTTDHGPAFPRMKCNLTDAGIGVMLIMRGPGGFSGGQVCDALVSQIDLFPTICELAQIEPPPWLQGVSLLPLIRGEKSEIREEVFAEVTYHAAYEPQRCVRTARWKYIRRFEKRPHLTLVNCDDSESKSLWMRYGWGALPPEEEALYDLVFDGCEMNNLASVPIATDVLREMRERLFRWMQQTDDPLLKGWVAPPPGARVHDPDAISTREQKFVPPCS
ncbi:MAG: sulfatase family protein [Kiritimatiellia bacterium]